MQIHKWHYLSKLCDTASRITGCIRARRKKRIFWKIASYILSEIRESWVSSPWPDVHEVSSCSRIISDTFIESSCNCDIYRCSMEWSPSPLVLDIDNCHHFRNGPNNSMSGSIQFCILCRLYRWNWSSPTQLISLFLHPDHPAIISISVVSCEDLPAHTLCW